MNDPFVPTDAGNPAPESHALISEISLDAPPPTSQEDRIALGYYAPGKTYRQIAQLMNTSLSNAHTRVQRCLAQQQLRIEDFCAELQRQAFHALQQNVEAVAAAASEGDLRAYRALLSFANTSVRLAKLRDNRRWAKRASMHRLDCRPARPSAQKTASALAVPQSQSQ